MRNRVMVCCTALMLAFCTEAGIMYSSIPNGGVIPDGSPAGIAATAQASGYLPSISSVTVNLNITGDYNGDLYAYLSYGGVLVPLLNRVGVTATGGGNSFGYSTPGFNITLSSAQGAQDVHFYQNYSPQYDQYGRLTQTWAPDGRAIDPMSSPGSFDSASRVSFSAFEGMNANYSSSNPNGTTWTLFFADLSSGGTSQLVSWDLSITAVPEPANVALGIFAGLFTLVGIARSKRVQQYLRQTFAR